MSDAGADADGQRFLSVPGNGKDTVKREEGRRCAARCWRTKSRPVSDRPGLQGRGYRRGRIRAPIATRRWQRTAVREATWSHASKSPVPGEGRSPNGPADGKEQMKMANAFCRYLEMAERMQ
jgi:hypothetical protein